MELSEIKVKIASNDPQDRMKAITALKDFGPDIAVPLLLSRKDDREFMIRSFVAMGLGHKQNSAAYNALVDIVREDKDANVRSEAANSLGKYGITSIPILVEAFRDNEHWLMRLSLMPILEDMAMDHKISLIQFLELCEMALQDRDIMVQASGLNVIKHFADSEHEEAALEILERFSKSDRWYLRRQTALSLKAFMHHPKAKMLLGQLRDDKDHRVVGAILESLVS